jgi:hypothetical protein
MTASTRLLAEAAFPSLAITHTIEGRQNPQSTRCGGRLDRRVEVVRFTGGNDSMEEASAVVKVTQIHGPRAPRAGFSPANADPAPAPRTDDGRAEPQDHRGARNGHARSEPHFPRSASKLSDPAPAAEK